MAIDAARSTGVNLEVGSGISAFSVLGFDHLIQAHNGPRMDSDCDLGMAAREPMALVRSFCPPAFDGCGLGVLDQISQ